jgi:hypothetical protein
MSKAFVAYRSALDLWETIGNACPELTAIPEDILADTSDKGTKTVARMKRNYRFDRARYYLPVAAATNLMLVMSSRGWAQLCQVLSSHPLPEAQLLAEHIRGELKLSAPRLMKHAESKNSIAKGIDAEFSALVASAANGLPPALVDGVASTACLPTAHVTISSPADIEEGQFAGDLAHHDNRYAWIGSALRRTSVQFGWDAMAMAEIRDLNRHRTGNKHCHLRPIGFYSALDQLPLGKTDATAESEELLTLNEIGRRLSAKAHELLASGDPSYAYWTLMGTQFPFEHLTTADKFIYEAELRTGIGSHFRYAEHLKDALREWYAQYPETRGLILEGDAEPE